MVAAALLLSLVVAGFASAVHAAGIQQMYVCDGDPLVAELHAGAVDAADIPNRSSGTLPGAYVVLQWRNITLQLPRTNNAGPPSYSDGRWRWQQGTDLTAPTLAQRRGSIEVYNCTQSDNTLDSN